MSDGSGVAAALALMFAFGVFLAGFAMGHGAGSDRRMQEVEQGEVTIQVDHAPDIIYTCEIRREG
ncbi:MAG: hypothetical protein JKY86_15495 [Gammaproteobacteria bacterium]|nr:hypothetical protein [Gammaproteobacteria bacterium]